MMKTVQSTTSVLESIQLSIIDNHSRQTAVRASMRGGKIDGTTELDELRSQMTKLEHDRDVANRFLEGVT